jgi:2-oxoglutarate dehydrogenase E2 component (dihydrolipoamide succinyltransferase)
MKASDGDGGVQTAEQRLRTKSTPLVRKIAAEHSVDISRIPGSGYAGRVTKQDILGYIEKAPAPAAPTYDARRTTPGGSVEHPAVEPWPGDRVEPWSKIRKITADHMVLSKRVSAHVASMFEVDFTRVAQLRAKAKQAYTERGVSLTFLAFIVKACAENLRTHPIVNAAVSGDSTIYRGDINVGIAVALDWGLIVPVIKHADELLAQGSRHQRSGGGAHQKLSRRHQRSVHHHNPGGVPDLRRDRSSINRTSRSSVSARSRSGPR